MSDDWEEFGRAESESGEFVAVFSWNLAMGHSIHRLTVERYGQAEMLYRFGADVLPVGIEELYFLEETTVFIRLDDGYYCEVAFDSETLEPDNECPTGNIEDDGGRPADETDS